MKNEWKNGDILAYRTSYGSTWVIIFSNYAPYEGHIQYHALMEYPNVDNIFTFGTTFLMDDESVVLASEDERNAIFEKLNDIGYRWDDEKKTLITIDKELEFYKNLQIMSKVYAEIEKDKSTLAELPEQKNKLVNYLCMALPYGVICKSPTGYKFALHQMNPNELTPFGKGVVFDFGKTYYIGDIKPYLRPMSSMTEEEKKEMKTALSPRGTATFEADGIHTPMTHIGELFPYSFLAKVQDWLLEHHFDFMGLIPMDCAIEITEENNPYKD